MNNSVGFSCQKELYIKLEYIAPDEYKELKTYLKENHISNRQCTNEIFKLKHQLEVSEKKRLKAIELLNWVNEMKEKYTNYNPKEKDYLDKLSEILGEENE